MKRSTYKAFTLIEMLIVMGILVILMVVGVAAGRFAIDRSNEIAHKNGATQLYQAAQAHYTDEGKFPVDSSTVEEMTSTGGALEKYLDMGAFKGGSEATYYYFTNETQQAVLICVTLGGFYDITEKGIACIGNGFGDPDMTGPAATITKEKLDPVEDVALYESVLTYSTRSNWDGKKWINVGGDDGAGGVDCTYGADGCCATCTPNPKLGTVCPDVIDPDCSATTY